MKIEILCTGDEILTGKTVNTNYSHIARRLADTGLDVHWGTTVGDDRASLLQAFRQAGDRADAVIVNGGLGPTVDDLSQEVAAEACGVPLVLSDYWMERMTQSYARRGRVMPANNKKQAMLPANAEFIDNPIGTACGFAVTIGRARFLFTPGVPREMRRMLDEQVIPRLLALGGIRGVTKLKRFHTFGIGESRADEMLSGIEAFKQEGGIKLGFQAHYPQLETKLAVRGADEADLQRQLAPVEAEVRKRLGNFIIAEDEQTLEGVIMGKLREAGQTLSIVESFTGGNIAARLAPLVGAEAVFKRGVITREVSGETSPEDAAASAANLKAESGSSHALAVLMQLDEGADRPEFGATICIGIADDRGRVSRQARLIGGRDWVRVGAAELGLDCLRRHLLGLPVDERIDFERRDPPPSA
ncbi:MAG: CinA family nicotinamide mononucleotide deamidase-related protein [Reyranella sp.]|uniref:CinA family nicotinamide mononucleotide deamidase-related protein n=1 Tax=Reyranella sp. TaxID=1929291 RepID=UPI0011F7A550|nr:CinA family nicotinamide mononucleotide deamidase-related protein [Reyranella sp.]TAJ41731.1 MAG: CinA family nicotinamide mononucleotide deamidase-related protein [Reyranella sp.]